MGADELAALVARDERELELTLEDVALPVEQLPRWSAGTVPGTLVRRCVRARSGLTPTDAEALVASLTVALEEHGWRVDETAAGHSRCRATSASDTVSVEVLHVVATGRVAVIADAGPYPVTDDLAQTLRRQQREVAS
ncbi:hypothetical protein SAMN04488570_2852 [Nocardioides scoriae]|uniref:Uncharacterized protein n=2 Tax=Nocardioides scoriae TaxID=642780 RepID=A0A1H1VJC2_9ACTN|nr:hypothetical protein SAMN04488570_2852 [Nocardioides scoriae]